MPHIANFKTDSELVRELIGNLILNFYSNIRKLNPQALSYTLERGTEATLRHYLLKGIDFNSEKDIVLFPEIGLDINSKEYGFADVIINLIPSTIIVMETKAYWADLQEPEYLWDFINTRNFYKVKIAQPLRYINSVLPLLHDCPNKYVCILFFARLQILKQPIHLKWRTFNECEEDEFYAYDEIIPNEYGISIYGKVQKV
jgi:hypothetical protein